MEWESFLVALVLSATLIYQWYADRRRNARDLTVRMYERWTSDQLRTSRSHAWRVFHRYWDPADPKRKVDIRKFSEKEDTQWLLGNIEHFFDDLGRLGKAGELHKHLSHELFKDILDQWYSLFTCIDWCESPTDPDSWYYSSLKPHMCV